MNFDIVLVLIDFTYGQLKLLLATGSCWKLKLEKKSTRLQEVEKKKGVTTKLFIFKLMYEYDYVIPKIHHLLLLEFAWQNGGKDIHMN